MFLPIEDPVERTYSFVYPAPSYGSGRTWYLIHRGQVIGSLPAPRSARSGRQAVEALQRAYCAGPTRVDQTPPDDPDLILLVSLWFRAHPEELAQTLSPEAAKGINLKYLLPEENLRAGQEPPDAALRGPRAQWNS